MGPFYALLIVGIPIILMAGVVVWWLRGDKNHDDYSDL